MRSEPSDRAEMVNQLLAGDTFEVVERQEKWSLVRCDYDGYEGWVDNKQYKTGTPDVQLDEGFCVHEQGCRSGGGVCSPGAVAVERYLGAPYLWGGRTVMGIDCSGLTQVCFKACGIPLLRDASQQATQGIRVESLQEALRDDLCFFSNDEGRIVHVGIYLGDGKIVHSSGQVRIDTLTPKGIINDDTHQLTHTLHSIRRVGSQAI